MMINLKSMNIHFFVCSILSLEILESHDFGNLQVSAHFF